MSFGVMLGMSKVKSLFKVVWSKPVAEVMELSENRILLSISDWQPASSWISETPEGTKRSVMS